MKAAAIQFNQPISELFHLLFRVWLSEQDLKQLVYYLCYSAKQKHYQENLHLLRVRNLLVKGEQTQTAKNIFLCLQTMLREKLEQVQRTWKFQC